MSVIRILGIDPGFDRLGVCILDKEGQKETLVYSHCITTSRKDSFEKRLFHIGEALEEIITRYTPHELAIETLFFTNNQKTIITVADVEVKFVEVVLDRRYDGGVNSWNLEKIAA
jgi:crossover junction endodeoxyribonuclease RuvC